MNSLYNVGEAVMVSRPSADAYLLLDSTDRSTSTSNTGQPLSIPLTQPYNNFRLQRPENMVQGGFTRLQLTEVRFPYAIPNVNPRNNTFWVSTPNPAIPAQSLTAQITVLEGFYNGRDLADVLGGNPFDASGDPTPFPTGELNLDPIIGFTASGIRWQVSYLPNSATYVSINQGGFLISADVAGVPHPFELYPINPANVGTQQITRSLLDVMGFNSLSNWNYITQPAVAKSSVYAPLTYTRFIDIVSGKLTYHQNVRDSSTSSRAGTNMICRLYIDDETSNTGSYGYVYVGNPAEPFDPLMMKRFQVNVPAGSQPFVIHRQFFSPKTFNWQQNTAIDWIDIQLLDDMGQPLYVPEEGLPDFQITFKVSED